MFKYITFLNISQIFKFHIYYIYCIWIVLVQGFICLWKAAGKAGVWYKGRIIRCKNSILNYKYFFNYFLFANFYEILYTIEVCESGEMVDTQGWGPCGR